MVWRLRHAAYRMTMCLMLKYVHPKDVWFVVYAEAKPFKFTDAIMEKGSIKPANV
jgi:hypothetical protein